MKILILSDGFPPYQQGGAEKMAALLAKGYHQRGHDVVVITTVQKREEEQCVQWKGLKVYRLYSSYHERWRAYLSLYNPQIIKKACQIIADEKPTVVHAHNVHYYLSYHLLALIKRWQIPIVITFHDAMAADYGKFTQGIQLHDYSEQPKVNYHVRTLNTIKTYRFRYFPLRNVLIRWYLHHKTNSRIAVSHELRKFLEVNGIRCTGVIYNGIDPQEYEINPRDVRIFQQKFKLEGRKVFLFVGRGGFWKGEQQLIKALPLILQSVPEAVLMVMGREDRFANLLKQANNLGLHKHIICTGWLQDKELIAGYHAANVVVAPSICLDSFLTTVLEAFASRKPVIVSCFSGSKEAVIDNHTGYVINPLNIKRLAERISELLINEQKCQQMGLAGYQRLLKFFSLDKCVQEYLNLFDTLI